MRRPDATTRWLLDDFKKSGLTMADYERDRGIIFEELPLPSPATQRIRRHERSFPDLDMRREIKPRPSLVLPPASPEPTGTMSDEMREARARYYEQGLGMAPIACAGCGAHLAVSPGDQRIVCPGCRSQLVERARDL